MSGFINIFTFCEQMQYFLFQFSQRNVNNFILIVGDIRHIAYLHELFKLVTFIITRVTVRLKLFLCFRGVGGDGNI